MSQSSVTARAGQDIVKVFLEQVPATDQFPRRSADSLQTVVETTISLADRWARIPDGLSPGPGCGDAAGLLHEVEHVAARMARLEVAITTAVEPAPAHMRG